MFNKKEFKEKFDKVSTEADKVFDVWASKKIEEPDTFMWFLLIIILATTAGLVLSLFLF